MLRTGRNPRFVALVRRLGALLLLAGSLSLGGCGWLSDYERHMASEQARLDHLDEEEKYLGDPLELPKTKEKGKDVAPPDVFLRPPKGIPSSPDQEQPAPPAPFLRYGSASGSRYLYLAWASANQNNFSTTAASLLFGDQATPVRVIKPAYGRQPLTLDAYEGPAWALYIDKTNALQVAVAYHLPNRDKGLDLSLGTLAVGPDALKARSAYLQQNHH